MHGPHPPAGTFSREREKDEAAIFVIHFSRLREKVAERSGGRMRAHA
jgi:hypothetical protein